MSSKIDDNKRKKKDVTIRRHQPKRGSNKKNSIEIYPLKFEIILRLILGVNLIYLTVIE